MWLKMVKYINFALIFLDEKLIIQAKKNFYFLYFYIIMKKTTLWIVALLTVATLAGCNNTTNTPEEEKNEIANPASVYCQENGGTLVLEEGAWLCMFEDGSYCEEWAYKNGECKPGDIIYNTVEENTEPTESNLWSRLRNFRTLFQRRYGFCYSCYNEWIQ